MIRQTSLFGPDERPSMSAPFAPGSQPSKEAADRQTMSKVERDRRRIFALITEQPRLGATDIELQAWANMGGSTERPRRGELVALGYIKKHPDGLKRRGAGVWVWTGKALVSEDMRRNMRKER